MLELKTKRCNGMKGCAILIALFGLLVAPVQAQEPLHVDITEGRVDPLPIAVPDFIGKDRREISAGSSLASVITNNLKRSGLFQPIDPRAFIERPSDFDTLPRFQDWRIIDSDALVTGQVVYQDDGRIRVEFRLWDVVRDQQMVGKRYYTTPENYRRVAHLISDEIYERLTGETGYFDTRVVYVQESGPKNNRRKRLAIMDQDGFNSAFLTDGNNLVMTPRFSPTSQEIAYLSYVNDNPRVFLLNIETGQQEVVGDFPGMTFAPRFSPGGDKIIMSLERRGNSDIYTMDLVKRRSTRLTDHPAIDTSPSYSPDGRYITFNSDRSGRQQIYVMRSDGTDVRRISFGEGKYATPVWSPRGDLIAFTKILKGRFYIGVMRPDGDPKTERLLTESFLDEGPTWSPNGRVLMFFRQTPSEVDGSGGTVRLWSVDLTGYNLRPVATPGDASDPAWSPLIK
ncbi:MAG: Tol-Pal system protein TolB [Alphaproteobacteria bacterium]|nr:MAG: Tol-Pal system protein TolB [Alphaproteobacteria bacterium]